MKNLLQTFILLSFFICVNINGQIKKHHFDCGMSIALSCSVGNGETIKGGRVSVR